jgi:hypothetical protein
MIVTGSRATRGHSRFDRDDGNGTDAEESETLYAASVFAYALSSETLLTRLIMAAL